MAAGFEPDVIGVTSTTNLFDGAVETAKKIKENFPGARLVLGGAHISANPLHALSCGAFDIGVIGEGEDSFPKVVRAIQRDEGLDGINGLALRKNGGVFFTGPASLIDDLDSLPFPARHLLPMHVYRPQPNDQGPLPKLSMIASRGCPYGCIFCDKSVFGGKYRSFTPRYIVAEMEHLIGRYGARDIAFLDSTFTASVERVEGIISEMKKRDVRVNWTCTIRADIVTRELLREMRDAGCWRVRLGIESGNDGILKFIRKGITKEEVRNAARWAHQLGLQPKGFFMIGHLTDTKETIKETMGFARSLPLKDITLQINTPMANTPQYKMHKDYGDMTLHDYSESSYWEPVFIPRGLSRRYLINAFHRFYRSFYLRPVILWRHIRAVRSLTDISKYFRALRLSAYILFKN
jgi:radical SAM superfamily enzyme YgiQ (UPF0313 family)